MYSPPPATEFGVSPHRVRGKREPETTRSRCGHPLFGVQKSPLHAPFSRLFRHIPYSIKPLSRKSCESPDGNSSTYANSPAGVPETAPQPSSTCLRTAFDPNANRTRPDRGSDTPGFPLFYKNVKVLFSNPLEPSLGSLRTEIGVNAVRREGKRGYGGSCRGEGFMAY